MARAGTHRWPARGHRHSLSLSAAVWSSVIAGLVFAALEMLLAPLLAGNSPWLPLHLIAGIGLGPDALAPANDFDAKIVSTAVGIHMALAILYGLILALIIERMDIAWAMIVGAMYGVALYYINFYGFSKAFPWFADARGGASVFTHIVQSAMMAWIYKLLDRKGR